jgi:hypothetical protein
VEGALAVGGTTPGGVAISQGDPPKLAGAGGMSPQNQIVGSGGGGRRLVEEGGEGGDIIGGAPALQELSAGRGRRLEVATDDQGELGWCGAWGRKRGGRPPPPRGGGLGGAGWRMVS